MSVFNVNEILQDAWLSVNTHQLGNAIRQVRQFLLDHPYVPGNDAVSAIENDYDLMLDYMKRGFSDPQREEIYNRLLHRMYACVMDLRLAYKCRKVQGFMDAYRQSSGKNFAKESIRHQLEDFVSETALLSLEADELQKEKGRALYERHQSFVSSLFCHLLLQPQWSDDDEVFYFELLLSPTIDVNDALLMVSAITLSLMNGYDVRKFRLLFHLYQQAQDEQLRQRALVGWVFGMSRDQMLFSEQSLLVTEACNDEQVVMDLVDMQKQVVFCLKAEADNDKIRRDIMPTLLKNQDFQITPNGIVEREEDHIDDILGTGESDRRMEELEDTFQKMVNMQQSGSDIYFGGFSQMKRFSFFYQISNWFCPFYLEHPGISHIIDKLGKEGVLAGLLENGPFCESDKYSFALAVSSVIDRLPANVRELFNSTDITAGMGMEAPLKNPAYIRRMYLQDLYRFARLYTRNMDFENPFSKEHYVFVSHPVFLKTQLQEHYSGLCQFFLKQKDEEAFGQVMHQWWDDDNVNCLLFRSIYYLDVRKQAHRAKEQLSKLLDLAPDNHKAILLMARASFKTGDMNQAAACYEKLHNLYPEHKSYALNYSIALCQLSDYQEALTILFRLDYENPDNPGIQRVLAWAQLGSGNVEAADHLFSNLAHGEHSVPTDFLHAGYCAWIKHDIELAASLIRDYLHAGTHDAADDHAAEGEWNPDLANELAHDEAILKANGITSVDIFLMQDLVLR